MALKLPQEGWSPVNQQPPTTVNDQFCCYFQNANRIFIILKPLLLHRSLVLLVNPLTSLIHERRKSGGHCMMRSKLPGYLRLFLTGLALWLWRLRMAHLPFFVAFWSPGVLKSLLTTYWPCSAIFVVKHGIKAGGWVVDGESW